MEEITLDEFKLVKNIVSKFNPLNESQFDDMCQAGFLGLILAKNNFNKKYGVKFTTYAYRSIFWKIREVSLDISKHKSPSFDLLKNYDLENINLSLNYKIKEFVSDLPSTHKKIANLIMEGFSYKDIKIKLNLKNRQLEQNLKEIRYQYNKDYV